MHKNNSCWIARSSGGQLCTFVPLLLKVGLSKEVLPTFTKKVYQLSLLSSSRWSIWLTTYASLSQLENT